MRISDWSSDVCSSDLTRRYIDDRAIRLRRQMIDQRVGQPDRAEDVGDDGGFGVRQVALRARILGAHDTGIVDKDVEVRMLRDNVFREGRDGIGIRSEEHTSELQSLMRISYAVFCLKKKKN